MNLMTKVQYNTLPKDQPVTNSRTNDQDTAPSNNQSVPFPTVAAEMLAIFLEKTAKKREWFARTRNFNFDKSTPDPRLAKLISENEALARAVEASRKLMDEELRKCRILEEAWEDLARRGYLSKLDRG